MEETENQPQKETKSINFSVNPSLIRAIPKDERNEELNDLELEVYDQQQFEEGVLEQIDDAMQRVEEQQIQEEIQQTRDKLEAAEQDIEVAKKKHDNKLLDETKTSCNKLGQKLKFLNQKLNAVKEPEQKSSQDISLQKVLGMGGIKETDFERRVRLGEITPFGTSVLDSTKILKKDSPGSSNSLHSYFQDQLKKARTKGKQTVSPAKKALDKSVKNVKEWTASKNRTPETISDKINKKLKKDVKNLKKLKMKRKSQIAGSKIDYAGHSKHIRIKNNTGYSDEEFIAPSDESPDNDDDAWSSLKKKRKIKKARCRSGGIYSNHSRVPPKRSKYLINGELNLAIDDGDEYYFQERLKDCEAKETQEQNELNDETEEDDIKFSGGYKICRKLWNKLYDYQKTCVKWLWELHVQQTGGIIADEMGLGKTIQIISFLAGLDYTNAKNSNGIARFQGLGPSIIVCPATVLHQWVKEVHIWWPKFRVAILHSSGSYSTTEAALVRKIVSCQGLIVTSYQSLLIYQEILQQHHWHYIVLDEGHKIRNPDAQITIICKQFKTPHRIILSGSPVQNNLKELWSLFDFIFPGKLGTLPDFMSTFNVPIAQGGYSTANEFEVEAAYRCACILRDTISPYMLRRMKSDVNRSIKLPQKNEQVLFCRLSPYQRDIYKEYLESKECQMIMKGEFMPFPGLITLRKICNHPDISTGGLNPQTHPKEAEENPTALSYGYYKRSGKMIVLQSLLKLWYKQEHRVLLFSQSRQMLNILEKYVKDKEFKYMRMDGTTNIGSRQTLISKFNSDQSIFIFLLTTRVGGLGVNLTGANRVIIFDPDWNPSTDSQARERAWRIGQQKDVTIYRLLTTGTIEEKIYHRQIFKQFLTNRVLQDPKQRRFFKKNDMHELFTLTDDIKGISETEAIFAGTGSILKAKKKNRFDEIRKEKKFSEEDFIDNEGIINETPGESNEKSDIPEEKLKELRKLAKYWSKKLEEKMAENTNSKEESKDEPECSKAESIKLQKKPKAKKRKDAKIDGERIDYLAKKRVYKQQSSTETTQKSTDQDDYVLQKLLKRSGVHTAMRHDKIVGASNPDYMLVENEANRVAREAVKVLKQSRARCKLASIGTPTWTGKSGAAGAPPLKRFGKKAETEKLVKSNSEPTFSGGIAGSSKLDDNKLNEPMSSNFLLSQMRARNLRMQESEDELDEENLVKEELTSVSNADKELLDDIRIFVSFGASIDGQATTDEIVQQFRDRISKQDNAKFKAMLRQVCVFERDPRRNGIWKLKEEFVG
ncbi:DgyrCDS12756 [Dimorphilus gyrociliatus]|uniref:DNA excision repair protein ERCC-6 n=1 Tax=Dimorphilus gyrociliatus TaxID=2664684 RepID=A0A7I8W8G1_9ANNE|nr:DgyrCDS12756 [Dimorphilus gyrociliatus]